MDTDQTLSEIFLCVKIYKLDVINFQATFDRFNMAGNWVMEITVGTDMDH